MCLFAGNNKIEGKSLIKIINIDFSSLIFLNLSYFVCYSDDNFIGVIGAKILTKMNLVNIK